MTTELLKQLAARSPFDPFTIQLNDGSRFKVDQPDGVVVPTGWNVNAIIPLGGERFTVIYVKNVSHVSSRGVWQKVKLGAFHHAGMNSSRKET